MIALFGFGNGLFPIMFMVVFILVVGMIIYTFVQQFQKNRSNRRAPRLTVPARVVAKTSHVTGGGRNSSAVTHYYGTFEVESGDRLELEMERSEYGMLAEGDLGRVTFQGTRFLTFDRD